MRAARWILGIAGAIVLLAVAAALVATLLIDPDRYKGRIEAAVLRETGRPLALQGHLRLSFFPWLGVRTGAARLEAPAGSPGPDLIDWRSAQVRVRLLPLLLHRELEVDRIRIVGAAARFRRGPGGRNNWDDLIARLHSTPESHAAPASSSWSATLAGLDLERSSLDFLDEQAHRHIRLDDWRLTLGPWRTGEPLSLGTSFVLRVNAPGAPPGTGLRLPAAGVQVSLEAPRLRITASPLSVSTPHWSLRVADARLDGALQAAPDGTGILAANGTLTASTPSLRKLTKTLGIAIPAPADPAALAALSLSGHWSYREGALEIKPLTARLDATTLTGWITCARDPTSPGVSAGSASAAAMQWRFALRADEIDFGRYMTRAKASRPLELPVSALRALNARGTLELERARIGDTTLRDARLEVQ